MQTWMYGLLAIPVVAAGAAYMSGAFSTDIPGINQKIRQTELENAAFTGDNELSPYQSAGRKKKTKKSKSNNKKTKRRG